MTCQLRVIRGFGNNEYRLDLDFENISSDPYNPVVYCINPQDAEKWARSVATDEWGTICSQKKVEAQLPGTAWWFDCNNHGGYVLIAPLNLVPEPLHKFAVDGAATFGEGWNEAFGTRFNQTTVFLFEHDCNWAVLEVTYPEVSRWFVQDREKGWASNPTTKTLSGERAKIAEQRLQSSDLMDEQYEKRYQSAVETVRCSQPPEVAEQLIKGAA